MVLFMKVHMLMVPNKAMENKNGQICPLMMVNGLKINKMDMECINGPTEGNMKANGEMEINMEKENMYFSIRRFMKEISQMIEKKDTVCYHGLMAENLKDNGKIINNTEKENMFFLMGVATIWILKMGN